MDALKGILDLAGSLSTALVAGPAVLAHGGPLGQALAGLLLCVGLVSFGVLLGGLGVLAFRNSGK